MTVTIFSASKANAPLPALTTIEKIRSFLSKPNGWHYGAGLPATGIAAKRAIETANLLSLMQGIVIEAFPRTDGGIVVSGVNDETVVDLVISPDGFIDVYIEQGDADELVRSKTNLPFIRSYLEFLGWKVTSSSGFFTRSTTATRVADSRVPQSPPQEMGYRLLMKRARSAVAAPSANTVVRTMSPEYQVTRRFSPESSSANLKVRNSSAMNRKVTSATS